MRALLQAELPDPEFAPQQFAPPEEPPRPEAPQQQQQQSLEEKKEEGKMAPPSQQEPEPQLEPPPSPPPQPQPQPQQKQQQQQQQEEEEDEEEGEEEEEEEDEEEEGEEDEEDEEEEEEEDEEDEEDEDGECDREAGWCSFPEVMARESDRHAGPACMLTCADRECRVLDPCGAGAFQHGMLPRPTPRFLSHAMLTRMSLSLSCVLCCRRSCRTLSFRRLRWIPTRP
jgi:flagellar motor protein MotB